MKNICGDELKGISYSLDYAATYLNSKKPQYNCSSIIHNLSKAQ